jgi:predicted nucleic acid-binding protein
MSGEDCRQAVDLLTDAPVTVPRKMRQLVPAASRLARDLDHPVYDCVYLALAMQEERPVITADRRFYDAVRNHPYLSGRVIALQSLDG